MVRHLARRGQGGDGGDFLPFLMEYRMIVEGAAEALTALREQYAALLAEPARRVRKRKDT